MGMSIDEAIEKLNHIKIHGADIPNESIDIQRRDIEALDMAIEALKQEPKSEWQQDHEILRAYSDGAENVLDKIRAEILSKSYKGFELGGFRDGYNTALVKVLDIIDKYKAESEDKE